MNPEPWGKMNYFFSRILLLAVITFFLLNIPAESWALASNNIPLDSPIFSYLDKLVGFGLVDTDFKGIRPYSKAEAARVVAEAEGNLGRLYGSSLTFAEKLIRQLKELLPREIALRKEPAKAPFFDYNPMAG